MTAAAQYSALASTVSALKSNLASPDDYDRLLRAESTKTILDFYQANYGIQLMTTGTIRAAERRLEEQYFQALRKILSISPFGLRQVLEAMEREHELKVLSSILNGIMEGLDAQELVQMITPFGRYDEKACKRLLETRSVRRAIELVEDPAIRQLLLDAVGRFGSEHHVGLVLSIDQASAKTLWGATMFLTGGDANGVRRILGQRFDLLNLLLLARIKKMGLSSAALRSLILHVNYRLKSSDLDELAELSTAAEQIARIRTTFYSPALQGISASDIDHAGVSILETAFNRYLARECSYAFSGSRFSAGLAIAFLFLKRFETCDLNAILTGKSAGLSKEEIREKMILHQEPGTAKR